MFLAIILPAVFSPVYLGAPWSQTGELTAGKLAVPSTSLVNALAEKNESRLTKVQRGEQAEREEAEGEMKLR